MTWTLPEPMLTTPVSVPDLRPGCAAEPKWDGFRALVSVDAGQVVLRSRRGTEMGPSFPEVVAGAVQLPDATALDGELVVWDAAGRLAFERLQNRLQRRGAGAARAAEEWPAHFVTGARTGSRVACCGRNAASQQVNGVCSTRHPMA
ncbi:ATP-dependent DNA ligase [Streptomyces sp. IBSBF 2806]|uniref:ATP-dependent DNA ligase n=1 Tax=Streptomyces sp. IBSBF 2806 TaxID=2903529 RepID=UPI002FDC73AA